MLILPIPVPPTRSQPIGRLANQDARIPLRDEFPKLRRKVRPAIHDPAHAL
jgi:hypothetical protein